MSIIRLTNTDTDGEGPGEEYVNGYFELFLADTDVRARASLYSNMSQPAPQQISLDERGLPVLNVWIDTPSRYDIRFFTRDGEEIGYVGKLTANLDKLLPLSRQLAVINGDLGSRAYASDLNALEARVAALEGPIETP